MVNDIMKQLIGLSIKSRLDDSCQSKCISDVQYAYEYKTVGARLHRRSGKSTWIKNFVRNISDRTLIVLPNESVLREYIDVMHNVDVISSRQDIGLAFRGKGLTQYQYIIFDEYYLMSQKAIDEIYRYTATSYNTLQTYITIGT